MPMLNWYADFFLLKIIFSINKRWLWHFKIIFFHTLKVQSKFLLIRKITFFIVRLKSWR